MTTYLDRLRAFTTEPTPPAATRRGSSAAAEGDEGGRRGHGRPGAQGPNQLGRRSGSLVRVTNDVAWGQLSPELRESIGNCLGRHPVAESETET